MQEEVGDDLILGLPIQAEAVSGIGCGQCLEGRLKSGLRVATRKQVIFDGLTRSSVGWATDAIAASRNHLQGGSHQVTYMKKEVNIMKARYALSSKSIGNFWQGYVSRGGGGLRRTT